MLRRSAGTDLESNGLHKETSLPANDFYKKKRRKAVMDLRRPMLFAIVAAVVVFFIFVACGRDTSPNGLGGYVMRTPPRKFTKPPRKYRKTFWAENTWKVTPFERAFRSRGFEMVERDEAQFILEYKVDKSLFKELEPWQRYCQIEGYKQWDNKESMVNGFKAYEERVGRQMYFNPETFRLSEAQDRKAFRKRLEDGGKNSPWVLKKPDVNKGKGIEMLGPNSEELLNVVARAKEEFEEEEERYIVQQYICNELTWNERKFDVRMFWYVASLDPLIVLYHDGYVRIGNAAYDESDFSETRKHLTTHTFLGDELKASFDDFQVYIEKYQKSARLPGIRDPVEHVRNQFKEILAELVAAFKDLSFDPSVMTAENGFAFYGADYILDKDLDVWLIEPQKGAGLHENYDFLADMDNSMARGLVDLQEEIWLKQEEGLPLLPLKNTGTWEIVYADGWKYSYEGYQRSKNKKGCAIKA